MLKNNEPFLFNLTIRNGKQDDAMLQNVPDWSVLEQRDEFMEV